MADSTPQTCPICSVKIVVGSPGGDRVLFSSGPPGTRTKLWARVCQFNQKPGCINQQTKEATIPVDDYYKSEVPTGDA